MLVYLREDWTHVKEIAEVLQLAMSFYQIQMKSEQLSWDWSAGGKLIRQIHSFY